MDLETIAKIILFGIALAMDAFAVSITDGLIYSDINKSKANETHVITMPNISIA